MKIGIKTKVLTIIICTLFISVNVAGCGSSKKSSIKQNAKMVNSNNETKSSSKSNSDSNISNDKSSNKNSNLNKNPEKTEVQTSSKEVTVETVNNDDVVNKEDDQGSSTASGTIDQGQLVISKAYANYDNTSHGFYFKKNDEHKPADTEEDFKRMLNSYKGMYLGDTSKKVIYLTFDEGYENGYTGKILDTLKEDKVPAAFFVTGDYVKRQSDLIRRMVDEGHIVGNHTVHHPSMPTISDEKVKDEITGLAEMYTSLTGEDMTYFRPPMGEFSERTLKITSDLGYKTVFWSYAYNDWDITKHHNIDEVYNKFMKNLHNGEIVLLHAVSPENAQVLDKIIKAVKAEGYEFKSLDDIK
jgi:peptidoglycan-N-acetylmuramic acid deacetylase